MRPRELLFGSVSVLVFAAGGFGMQQAEHNQNAVADACYSADGQPVAACQEAPAITLRHQLERTADIDLVLGTLGLVIGGVGTMGALDMLHSKEPDSHPDDDPDEGPEDNPPAPVLPFRPRNY